MGTQFLGGPFARVETTVVAEGLAGERIGLVVENGEHDRYSCEGMLVRHGTAVLQGKGEGRGGAREKECREVAGRAVIALGRRECVDVVPARGGGADVQGGGDTAVPPFPVRLLPCRRPREVPGAIVRVGNAWGTFPRAGRHGAVDTVTASGAAGVRGDHRGGFPGNAGQKADRSGFVWRSARHGEDQRIRGRLPVSRLTIFLVPKIPTEA
ncbi:hypothetical protein Stube_03900 [Streptomyces tubercidicus]|uniref:Uncharacterized protein n=1 Tax=Streptomyces tubercidicus TaxID=47759 RepID=A0A640UIU8_9ACTN|nr:hypothetical protein Stube_03900 [Streptomyces tubercidicus]